MLLVGDDKGAVDAGPVGALREPPGGIYGIHESMFTRRKPVHAGVTHFAGDVNDDFRWLSRGRQCYLNGARLTASKGNGYEGQGDEEKTES